MRPFIFAVIGLFLLALSGRTDELILKNGDKLTGTVDKLVDGKLTFKSALAGVVTVAAGDVKSLSTDAPVRVVLGDGTTLTELVRPGEGNLFAVGARQVNPDDLKAINPPLPRKPRWEGNAALNLALIRATTNSDNLDITAGVRRDTAKDRISADAGYLFGKQSGVTTTELWFANGDYNFAKRDRFYGFVNGRLRHDRIQGLDLRTILGAGVGYEWIKSADFNFRTEAGLSWLNEDFSVGGSTSKLDGQFGYFLDKKLGRLAQFHHDLSYYPKLSDFSDYYLLTQFVLEQGLSSSIFINARAIFDYTSTPPANTKRATSKYLLGIGKRF